MSYVTPYTPGATIASRLRFAVWGGAATPTQAATPTHGPAGREDSRASRIVGRDMHTLGRHILGHLEDILGGLGRSGHGLVWPYVKTCRRQDAVTHTIKTTSSDLHTLISNMGLIFADSIGAYTTVAIVAARRSMIAAASAPRRPSGPSALSSIHPGRSDRSDRRANRRNRRIAIDGRPRSGRSTPIDLLDSSPILVVSCQLVTEVDGTTKLAPRRWISATETLVAQGFPVHPHFPRRSPQDFLCSFNRMIAGRQHRTVCSQTGNAMHVTVAGACNVRP